MAGSPRDHALRWLAESTGFAITLDDRSLAVEGASLVLPDFSRGEALFSFRHAFPTVPHGERREKLLYWAIQEAGTHGTTPGVLDGDLYRDIDEHLPKSAPQLARTTIADALRDKFFVQLRSTPFLLPLHADLPSGFAHTLYDTRGKPRGPARYRMFSGLLLPYLCWDGEQIDEDLLAALFKVLNSEEGLTLLDGLMLEAARTISGKGGQPASAAALAGRHRAQVQQAMRDGAFCQPSLEQFQQDLQTVLAMPLPRGELVNALNLLLSLHLTVRFYRLSEILGRQLDTVIAAAGQLEPGQERPGCDCSGGLRGCPFAGRIQFRTGTGGFQPVSLRDPCVLAYDHLHRRRLLALPAAIATANLARMAWEALGGPGSERPPLAELAGALRADGDLRRRFNAMTAALAIAHLASVRPQAEEEELIAAGAQQPGLHALRQVVLKVRRKDLRHTSQDVVNQLAKLNDTGNLIRQNSPRATFFELDEDLLFLLVRLICGTDSIPYGEFLERLACYGLAPQHDTEKQRLSAALERLGMLVRYSDAGEAAYVHHWL